MAMREELARLDELLDSGAAERAALERERMQREAEMAQDLHHAEAATAIRGMSI
jgi:hypothetical protein